MEKAQQSNRFIVLLVLDSFPPLKSTLIAFSKYFSFVLLILSIERLARYSLHCRDILCTFSTFNPQRSVVSK